MIDEIIPDHYAQITAADHQDDDGDLLLTVSTVDPIGLDRDLTDTEIVLTAELPDADPITVADRLLRDIGDWTFLRGWYLDGDDIRAELELHCPLNFPRVDVYFLDDEHPDGELEEIRICKHDENNYFAMLPQSDDRFDIWFADDCWFTDAYGGEDTGYRTLPGLIHKVFLTV